MDNKELIAPVAQLVRDCEDRMYESTSLDLPPLKNLGFFVIRNALSPCIKHYQKIYDQFSKSENHERTNFHLTEIKVVASNPLTNILNEPAFKDSISKLFDGNIGLFNFRIVRKDNIASDAVFLHQDLGYQIGGFDRCSAFVPLTKCNPENGGLTLYPGTHHYGYLGDAGEISEDILPVHFPRISPNLNPGDLLIMNSALWHSSPPNFSKEPRVYLDIHIQPADDSSTKKIILGGRKCSYVNNLSIDDIFISSRTKKLREFYNQSET